MKSAGLEIVSDPAENVSVGNWPVSITLTADSPVPTTAEPLPYMRSFQSLAVSATMPMSRSRTARSAPEPAVVLR